MSSKLIPSLTVLEEFDFAAIQLCTIQLLYGILHITVRSKLDHPKIHTEVLVCWILKTVLELE